MYRTESLLDSGEAEAPNALPISRRERVLQTVKKPTISRAKRSAAWACSAASGFCIYGCLSFSELTWYSLGFMLQRVSLLIFLPIEGGVKLCRINSLKT